MEANTDRRVKRTKAILRGSLLSLMREKAVTKITPTELCRKADINRNTFYSHYESVGNLLQSIENELIEQIRRSLCNDKISVMIVEICRTIHENRDICSILLSDNGNRDFLHSLIYSARERSVKEWKAAGLHANEEQIDLMFSYFASGSIAVIRDWILNNLAKTPEYVAQFILNATNFGLSEFTSAR